MTGLDALTHRRRDARGEPDGALVLFHGRGADEHDLYPLIDMLDPAQRLVAFTPRGPLSLPPGGAHWYAVHRVGFPDPATFTPTFAQVKAWLAAVETETGIPRSRTVLSGFSQGAVMSFALGLATETEPPAAIAAFSGFIPVVEGYEPDLSRTQVPVAIAHGTYDPVIEVGFGRSANERLTGAGFDVTFNEYPVPHTIHPDSITVAASLIERVLFS